MKKFLFLLFFLPVVLTGCSENFTPMNVTIKNQTLLNSPQTTLTVVYAEDKRIRDKFTDILISSKVDNLAISIAKELGTMQEIVLEQKDTWYSLSALLGKTPVSFSKVESITFVLTSSQNALVAVKAIGGELNEGFEGKDWTLKNTFDVSKQVFVNLQQTTQNT
jgi:hypothetical protein